MATLTFNSASTVSARDVVSTAGGSASGWFTRFFRAMIEARARKAQSQVDGYLATLNDETLIDLGLDPASVRHGDPLNRFYL